VAGKQKGRSRRTAIGKQETLGADFQAVIWKIVNVNILAHEPFGKIISLQGDPLAVIRQSQLASNVALLAVAQYVGQFSTEKDRGRCRFSGRAEGMAKRSLNWVMKASRNAFPALMSQTLASAVLSPACPIVCDSLAPCGPSPDLSWHRLSRYLAPPMLDQAASFPSSPGRSVCSRGRLRACQSRRPLGNQRPARSRGLPSESCPCFR